MDKKKWYFIIFTINVLLYFKVVYFDFIDYDDPKFITSNLVVLQGLSLNGIKWAFTTFTMSHWHPLIWLSYMLEVSIFGVSPAAFHLNNLIIHFCNSCLLFSLLSKTKDRIHLAGFVSLLFALHPMHIEAVVWISSRKDVLCTFFTLLSIYCYIQYVFEKRRVSYYLSLLLFIMGMMSKAMIVTLPLLLLVIDFWPLRRFADVHQKCNAQSDARTFWVLIKEKRVFFTLALLFGVMAFIPEKFGGAVTDISAGWSNNLGFRVVSALFSYIYKTVWPVGLYMPYIREPETQWLNLLFGGGTIILVSWYAVLNIRSKPYLLAGWLWFIISLLPVIGLVPFSVHYMADRYSYVPHIGLFIMFVWVIDHIRENLNLAPKGVYISLSIVCITIYGLSWRQADVWQNTVSLARNTLQKDPDNHVAHFLMGLVFARAGNDKKAQLHYSSSLEKDPKNPATLNNLGEIVLRSDGPEEALSYFTKALHYLPESAAINANLARVYLRLEDNEQAKHHLMNVLVLDPKNVSIYNQLAEIYIKEKDYSHARQLLFHAKSLNPDYKPVNNNILKLDRLNGSDAQ